MTEMLSAGTVIADRFKVVRPLGRGGMGMVYEAEQVSLGRRVAIKIMFPQLLAQRGTRERFEREARVAATLHHPNIVEIIDFGEHEGVPFLAMEYLSGQPLRKYVDLDLDPLSVPRACAIAREIAAALTHAHERKLVHRDIKPENVMLEQVDRKERVTVVDFGLAFVYEGNDPRAGRMTREGVVTGTPDYLSPEQARGSIEIGPASDIYSLGCLFYEMLCASPPFLGEVTVVVARHMYMDPPLLRSVLPSLNVPVRLEEEIRRMLEKKPESRPTARAVFEFLSAFDAAAPERFGGRREGVQGREARMVSAAPAAASEAVGEKQWMTLVAGSAPPDLLTALGASNLRYTCVAADVAVCHPDLVENDETVVVALGLSRAQIAAWIGVGLPVIAQAQSPDVQEITELLQLGVVDVIVAGSDFSKLVEKIRKATK